MNLKLYHKITAAAVFIVTLVLYISAMQPTFAFWDPGEYTAVSAILGIPHPPGVPFNVLIGRVFSLIPFGDISMRIALTSVLSSAFAVLFVYLISVKIITSLNGKTEETTESILVYASSAIGALALAFCGTFWFNAMETESESKAILFITLMLWLMLIWREKQEEPGNEKYLLLCFFLIGLGVGAHLLVVQTILIIGLIYYISKYRFSFKSAAIAFLVTISSFFIIFPGIIIKLPKLIDASPIAALIVIILLILGVIYGNKIHSVIKFASLSILFVILGYSIYTTVILRASVENLPINQNSPNNFSSLVSYLGREQYGEEPKIWPRRWSEQPQHRPTWENYSSDLDFLWNYQIKDMYLRYLAWQFVGRDGYNQGDGVDPKKLFAIPLIIGLLGLYYVFRKDRKTAFILLATFLTFGVITALYQNQQNMQPRDREYFYVVSYMIFAVWIGLGSYYLAEKLKQKVNPKISTIVLPVLIILLFIIIPLNMLRDTYKYQNRSGNFLPFDYAYNILQSVEKDAILITNGDNDTFPLWCLQSAYGIRTDVRIINLSLANTDWYNLQLKNERPFGSQKVPFNYNDEQLKRLQPTMWDENRPVVINVPVSAYPDTMSYKPGSITFKIPATIRQRNGNKVTTALQASDLVVLDIIKANNWQRPIYFSSTVSENYCIGLSDYLILEGMAQRLVPYLKNGVSQNVNHNITEKCLMLESKEPVKEPNYGFLFRNTNNPNVFYDEVHERSITSYRMLFYRYALSLSEDTLQFDKAISVLNRMEEKIPRNIFKMDYRFKYYLISIYNNLRDYKKAYEYANESEKELLEIINDRKSKNGIQDEAYMYLSEVYTVKKEYKKAIDILNVLSGKYPNDPSISKRKNDILLEMSK